MCALVVNGKWYPLIGDPTWMGWITVAAYFGAAILSMCCGRRVQGIGTAAGSSGREFFWYGLALLLLVLGANKQLDLQTWLTVLGKEVALAQGWYESRRPVQLALVLLVGMAGAAFIGAMAWLGRRGAAEHRIALGGAIFLACFVVIRAASFHHVDQLLGMRFAGLKVNWVLELGGIAAIAAGSVQGLRVTRRAYGPHGPRQFVFVQPPGHGPL